VLSVSGPRTGRRSRQKDGRPRPQSRRAKAREARALEAASASQSTSSPLDVPITPAPSRRAERDGRGVRGAKQSKHDRRRLRDAKLAGETRMPPEEEHGFSISEISQAHDPYSHEESLSFLQGNAPGGTPFDVDPRRLRTMHAGVSERFSDDRRISDTADQLRRDPRSAKDLPPITLRAIHTPIPKWHRGQEGTHPKTMLFSEDHRRVMAARNAGLSSMKAQFVSEGTKRGKFTTRDLGRSAEVRRYVEQGKGRHQREPKVTLPAGAKPYEWRDDESDDDG
jgi:hypothetical protein